MARFTGQPLIWEERVGATAYGGANGYGTIFTIAAKGNVTDLYSFSLSDGDNPATPIVGSDGNFYGTTASGGSNSCPFSTCGTIFALSSGSDSLTTLFNFDGNNGAEPGIMLQGTGGEFYGTAVEGGNYTCGSGPYGCGTIFSLNMELGPFVAFVRAGGKVDQNIGILGQGFAGTTSVSFNGVPATFTVVSDTFLRATVPSGATNGYVTVTTPGGTLTSNVPFQVIQ
jgi:uncharacterized repeat protein (TIGR03803 family)